MFRRQRPRDEYEAADEAVDVAREEPGFDETMFRRGFHAGYVAGQSDGFAEGFSAGVESANR